MKNHRFVSAGIATAALVPGLLVAAPAFAGHIKTFVTVTPPGPFVFDGTSGPTTQDVSVGLDKDSCLKAFSGGQSYTIVAKSDNTAVATVPTAPSAALQCGDATTVTITGVGNGGATIEFDAVSAPGLQSQVTNARVQVTGQNFSTDGGPNPDGHGKPAAPAVANGFLRANADQAATCKASYGTNSWHGQLIHAVAKWAAENHYGKLKNTMSDDEWMTLVENEVISLCSPQP
jgi:hypothetical protein